MLIQKNDSSARRGQMTVLTIATMPVLIGAALICTDSAVLISAEAQMKVAADAGALAGAMALVDETRVRGSTDLSSLMSTARDKVISVASNNLVLNSAPVLSDNTTNSNDGDIVIGYLDPNGSSTSALSTSVAESLFNSVQVNVRRDASHGGPISTVFAGAAGIGSTNLGVSSTASVQNYAVTGFQSINGDPISLLPFVLDSATYTAMMNRTTADQYSYDTSSGTVSMGADGVPESQLYPVSTGNPGNWGAIKVGVSNNSTSTLSSQIRYGITSSQMATFPGGVIEVDSSLDPPSITFSGNPGISAGIKSALLSRVGTTGYIGIYDQSSGNGSNTTYRVIEFAAIRVMACSFQGNPKYVVVQPALIKDSSAITGSAQSSWTNGGVVKVHLTR